MQKQNSIREKNQQAVKQQTKFRSREHRDYVITVNKRFSGLTKKNKEYMLKLNKLLDKRGYNQNKKDEVLKNMYDEIKLKQKKGILAIKLYGPVTTMANNIINGPQLKKNTNSLKFWQLSLDNGLLMLMLFCIMYGIMEIFDKKQVTDAGWITLFSTAIIAGLGLGAFYKIIGNRDQTNRYRIIRGILSFVFLILAWFIAFEIIARIPARINVAFNPICDFILAAISFGIRYMIKKKFHINSYV